MGKRKASIDGGDAPSLATSIIATIISSENGKSMNIKELRKSVLSVTNTLDGEKEGSADKSTKKLFKHAVKQLEKDERVTLSADGIVKLSKAERKRMKFTHDKGRTGEGGEPESTDKKHKKKKKKDKKREKKEDNGSEEKEDGSGDERKKIKLMNAEETQHTNDDDAATIDEEEDYQNDNSNQHDTATLDSSNENKDDPSDKNNPCKNNPQGITRLFLGNLPFAISEPTLNTHLKECVTHIKWITDKQTGKFYGSAFCEVRNSKDAAMAMTQINGTLLMGRPIKINYAPVRSGEETDWPPRSKVITGGKVANAGGGQAGGSGIKAMSVKPEGCCKLFIGNLSYDIDDDGITKFFMGVDAELKSVRWLHHRDSGDFKGCGYADFWNTEACEKAATLNGKNLLGRPIRIDWAE